MHGAGAALREPATEMRIVESDVVTQRVEQRHVWIDIDRVVLAVDVQREFLGHGGRFPRIRFLNYSAHFRSVRIKQSPAGENTLFTEFPFLRSNSCAAVSQCRGIRLFGLRVSKRAHRGEQFAHLPLTYAAR